MFFANTPIQWLPRGRYPLSDCLCLVELKNGEATFVARLLKDSEGMLAVCTHIEVFKSENPQFFDADSLVHQGALFTMPLITIA